MADLEAERKKRRDQFINWPVEKELPPSMGPWHLKRIDEQKDRIYYAFGYENEDNGWFLRALFDEETMDYMVKTDFRLFVLSDIDLISGSWDWYRENLPKILPANMKRELIDRDNVSILVRGKYFMTWKYQDVLPEAIGNYKRVIVPSFPLLGLNGSYIIAAYEWKEGNKGILFFYNTYRNDYYGEMRSKGIPVIIHQYDAATAEELGEKIQEHLQEDLKKLSRGGYDEK